MILHPPYPTTSYQRAVGVFAEQQSAHQALQDLQASHFPMDQVSVIVRKTEHSDKSTDHGQESENKSDYKSDHKLDEGAAVGALSGGALGGLTGLLVGLGTLAIPGVGPIMLAGAAATTIATTLAGGAIGAVAGGLVGALVGLGIPEEQAKLYHDRIAQGDCFVVVEGSSEEIALVGLIFQRWGIEEYKVYNLSVVSSAVNQASAPVLPATTTTTTTTVSPSSQPIPAALNHSVGGIDLTRSKYGIGIFSDVRDAGLAINDLKMLGFPIGQISLVTLRMNQPKMFVGVTLRDRLDAMRLGMPADRARFYNDHLTQGHYIMTVSGTESEIRHAAAILENRGIQVWQMYDPTAIDAALPVEASPTPSPSSVPQAIPAAVTAPADYTLSTPVVTNHAAVPHKQAIGVFSSFQQTEVALARVSATFPRHQMSIMAKQAAQEGTNNLSTLFVGLGTLAVPGIGSVMVGGSEATAVLADALAEGAIATATKGIIGALVRRGIPKRQAKLYNDRLIQGEYLVIVNGTEDLLRQVEAVFKQQGILNWGIYATLDSKPAVQQTSPAILQTDSPRESDRDKQPQIVERQPQVTVIDHRRKAR